SCESQLIACDNSDGCSRMFSCVSRCSRGDENCQKGCVDPAAVAEGTPADVLLDCMDDECEDYHRCVEIKSEL
ncbi:MAG: hypothetical protein FWD57_07345, partial [Polyangiaceae bacterium]|nr:hypothetical protein [Polyangiaceae bacterium]